MAKEKEQQLTQDVESLQNRILELEERRKSLQESENLLSIITRTTSLSIFIIQNEKVCFINKAGENLFGLKASDIFQTELEALVSAEDFAFIKSDNIINPGETLADRVKVRVTNPIKGERIVEITVVSIFYKGKIAFACTAYDTTCYNHANDISEDNQLLLKIIDSMPVGVSLSDVHGTIIAENKIMHDIWQNGSSVPGNDKIKVYNSLNHELIKQDEWIVTRALQNSEKILNEVVDIEIENNKKTVNISAIPLEIDQAKTNGLILVCEDITKLKHANLALRRSEEYYRSLFENMREGFAFCQMLFENEKPVDFICLDVNNAFGELTGLTNVNSRRITEILPGLKSSNPELFEICGRVALSGRPERSEVFLEPLSIWLSVSVYCPEKGYFILVFDNITKKKQADDALRESEERFRRIFKEGPIGVVIVGLNLRFTNANNRFCDMVGYMKNEINYIKKWQCKNIIIFDTYNSIRYN
jgi:PAS domain S-box-containing protein